MEINMSSVYEIITQRIIERIEETGVLPWKCPWKSENGQMLEPQNFVTKKPYRGINLILLNCMGYTKQFWLTFNQCKQLGGTIKKGEKNANYTLTPNP